MIARAALPFLLVGLAHTAAPSAAPSAVQQAPAAPELAGLPAWGPHHVEHLLNRAAFGAGQAEVEAARALGPTGLVESLLAVESYLEEPFYARKRADGDLGKYVRSLPDEQREQRMKELRDEDRAQVDDFLDWWVGRMLAGQEPLRERMVLFWHGHFTSSMEAVHSSYEMIQQNQLFRRHGLGSFRALLHAVARDPAMLLYLDNTSSKKTHPNENFARELLELFTLGEGHYSEQDVREVARAFTGWGQRNGRFHFDKSRHDNGRKVVLGVEGRLDGDDVLDILLAQQACARHLAHALLVHFEGIEPTVSRVDSYAESLRESGYLLDAFLRRLFLDPDFYSPDVLAQRVASPLDYLLGSTRRLGLASPARVVVSGAALLGQRLFFPPSVRGWEGGEAWATSSGLLLRGELAGMLLGRVRGRDLVAGQRANRAAPGLADAAPGLADAAPGLADAAPGLEPEPEPAPPSSGKMPPELRALSKVELRPRLNLTQRLARAVHDDAELARALLDELLAIPPSPELVVRVEARLAEARAQHELSAPWVTRPELAEPLLRELAHGILTLPEAQLD
jgi:uncharacterized protein (DUF1800 family)